MNHIYRNIALDNIDVIVDTIKSVKRTAETIVDRKTLDSIAATTAFMEGVDERITFPLSMTDCMKLVLEVHGTVNGTERRAVDNALARYAHALEVVDYIRAANKLDSLAREARFQLF